jgi:hypothetical protein
LGELLSLPTNSNVDFSHKSLAGSWKNGSKISWQAAIKCKRANSRR